MPDSLFTPNLIMEIAEATEDYQVTPSEFSQIMGSVTSIVAGFAITGMVGMLIRTIAKEFAEKTPFEVKEVAGVPLPVPEYQASTEYEYYISIPVTYRQASTSAGRRYIRERMAEIRKRILKQCPDAEIKPGFVIGELMVKCSKPISAKDLGRGIEVAPV